MARWETDKWCVLHADFRQTLSHAAEQGGCDLVATSPPYGIARTYGNAVQWGLEDYAALGDAIFCALKPGGHAIINIDAPVREHRKGMGTERGLEPFRLVLDWTDRVGFRMPDRLAFGRKGAPGVYQGRFRNDWEFLFWFQKPGASGFFAKELLKEEATHKSYHKLRGVRRPDGSMYQRESTIEVRHRGNWWEYGCVGNGQSGAMDLEAEDHPARWPFNLAWDLIRCFAPKDGRVCDPFCGAGTTGAAAIEHGCHFLGGDLLENSTGEPWAAIAHRILLKRTQQVKLF